MTVLAAVALIFGAPAQMRQATICQVVTSLSAAEPGSATRSCPAKTTLRRSWHHEEARASFGEKAELVCEIDFLGIHLVHSCMAEEMVLSSVDMRPCALEVEAVAEKTPSRLQPAQVKQLFCRHIRRREREKVLLIRTAPAGMDLAMVHGRPAAIADTRTRRGTNLAAGNAIVMAQEMVLDNLAAEMLHGSRAGEMVRDNTSCCWRARNHELVPVSAMVPVQALDSALLTLFLMAMEALWPVLPASVDLIAPFAAESFP